MLAHFKMFDEYMSVSSFSYKYGWPLTEMDVVFWSTAAHVHRIKSLKGNGNPDDYYV